MKFFATAVALVSVLPSVLGLTINTPMSVVECEPVQFTWTAGTPPYYLTILPGGQPSATPLLQFPTQTGTSVTWNVNIQANVQITIALKDSTGTVAYTDTVTIQAGPDTSCLTSSASISGATGSTPAATSPAGASSAAGATSSPAASPSAGTTKPASGTTPAAGSGTTTGSAAAHSSSSGAGRLAPYGVAGVMGLLGAVLL